jgi:hypothetical protein
LFAALIGLSGLGGPVAVAAETAGGGYSLLHTFRDMYESEPVVDSAKGISQVKLSYPDFQLRLDTGILIPFHSASLDSNEVTFAAYFAGVGSVQFAPPVDIERSQLRRFYGSDSLNRPVENALLLFGPGVWDDLIGQVIPVDKRPSRRDIRDARDRWEDLTEDENYLFVFECLQSYVSSSGRPFLLINLKPRDAERTYYIYNPLSREEISLYRENRAPGQDYMELVNSYHEGIDSTCENMNGTSKARIHPLHYGLDGSIDRKGTYIGSARIRFAVEADSLRTLRLSLHKELTVDSVRAESGDSVAFLRYRDDDNKSLGLFLFLDDGSYTSGDTGSLTVYYEGDIAKANLGLFDVTAGGSWYPHVSYHQSATFDMTFRTPVEYEFVAVGEETARDTVADTLMTRWRVDQPVPNVSFSIGPITKYRFAGIVPIDVYYSKDVHERITWGRQGFRAAAGDMQEEVADDIVRSLGYFSDYYGPFPFDRLVVTEVFSDHGEAFPGFLHLGQHTWLRTDTWGRQRLFRAHEAAHQWWGAAVGHETYHDQWLAEAFAEYAAITYYRQAESAGRFHELLDEYRDQIFSARKYGFGIEGAEAGPIILGARTASSKTEGDYQLIVYKKGAWVLHMLQQLLDPGDRRTGYEQGDFRRILRRYFRDYSGRRATTADFIRIVEEDVGRDMSWFFNEWIYRTDLPTFETAWDKGRDSVGAWYVEGTVSVEGVDSSFMMPVPVTLTFVNGVSGAGSKQFTIEAAPPERSFRIADLKTEPVDLKIDDRAVLCRIK